MLSVPKLPDLEKTITDLVVELLLMDKERDKRHRNLLFADPEDAGACASVCIT